jgi:hypothetical protein
MNKVTKTYFRTMRNVKGAFWQDHWNKTATKAPTLPSLHLYSLFRHNTRIDQVKYLPTYMQPLCWHCWLLSTPLSSRSAVPPCRNCINTLTLDSFGALLRFCRELFAASKEITDLDSAAFQLLPTLYNKTFVTGRGKKNI